jgi:hypothetical protein
MGLKRVTFFALFRGVEEGGFGAFYLPYAT